MAMPAIRYAAEKNLAAEKNYIQLAIDNCKSDAHLAKTISKAAIDLPPFYQGKRQQKQQSQLMGENRSFLLAQYEQKQPRRISGTPMSKNVQLPILRPVAIKRTSKMNTPQFSKNKVKSTYHHQAKIAGNDIWLSELGVCALLVMPYLLIAK